MTSVSPTAKPAELAANPITRALKEPASLPLRLMTHLIAGYPQPKANIETAVLMAAQGVSFLEVQLPFSDPLADGAVIMRANHRALKSGMTTAKSLAIVKTLQAETALPILVMTYYNIVFRMGINRFLDAVSASGAAAVIIPDLPYDEPREAFFAQLRHYPIHPIFVLAPNITDERLTDIAARASGFVYTTLRTGITGAQTELATEGLAQFKRLKNKLSCPIAAGFGISSPEQLPALCGLADIAVIGSHLLSLAETTGLGAVETFLKACRRTLSEKL